MYYHVKCENWFIFKICREDNTMSLHGSKGFSLIELMVVIAIMGVMVALATPSMLRMTHQSQVNAEARSLVAKIQETRSQAVLEKRNVTDTWMSSRSHIQAGNKARLALEYNFMGLAVGAWEKEIAGFSNRCLNIVHTTSSYEVVTSVRLEINGRIQVFKNKKDCRG